jgi:hypothetical protein
LLPPLIGGRGEEEDSLRGLGRGPLEEEFGGRGERDSPGNMMNRLGMLADVRNARGMVFEDVTKGR